MGKRTNHQHRRSSLVLIYTFCCHAENYYKFKFYSITTQICRFLNKLCIKSQNESQLEKTHQLERLICVRKSLMLLHLRIIWIYDTFCEWKLKLSSSHRSSIEQKTCKSQHGWRLNTIGRANNSPPALHFNDFTWKVLSHQTLKFSHWKHFEMKLAELVKICWKVLWKRDGELMFNWLSETRRKVRFWWRQSKT